MYDVDEELKGHFRIACVGEALGSWVRIERVILHTDGSPSILISDAGVHYNWRNIVSMRKEINNG